VIDCIQLIILVSLHWDRKWRSFLWPWAYWWDAYGAHTPEKGDYQKLLWHLTLLCSPSSVGRLEPESNNFSRALERLKECLLLPKLNPELLLFWKFKTRNFVNGLATMYRNNLIVSSLADPTASHFGGKRSTCLIVRNVANKAVGLVPRTMPHSSGTRKWERPAYSLK